MEVYIKILCFFRKRVVLSLIFLFSLAYFLLQFNALQLIRINRKYQDDDGEFEEINYKRDSPLIWRSLKEYNLTDSEVCKNSIQGINLIVDERGFLCSRDDLKSTGCCNIQAENTHIYYCETCDDVSKCCEVYEHCVSCCLNPDNVPLLQKAIAQAQNDRQKLLFLNVLDQFDLCLSICRSNSQSVVNEHFYKSPKKHCFTKTEPHD
ncbi:unnamed protein product [Chironomus riparius]|uniref:SREBP regulating gene protein n=1 Tax=Chironomus riparius TaxID=315576 RepID=A0A9N9RPF3_9DIPT|nr:unnamed protein product [Chironomus riparius]